MIVLVGHLLTVANLAMVSQKGQLSSADSCWKNLMLGQKGDLMRVKGAIVVLSGFLPLQCLKRELRKVVRGGGVAEAVHIYKSYCCFITRKPMIISEMTWSARIQATDRNTLHFLILISSYFVFGMWAHTS